MNLGDLKFHAPCVVNDGLGTSQLEERVALGYNPGIMGLAKVPSDDTISDLRRVIEESPELSFGFNFGGVKGKSTDYEDAVSMIAGIRDNFPGSVDATISMKFDSAVAYGPEFNGVNATFSLSEYEAALERNIELVQGIAGLARSRGLSLGFENKPRPNFGVVLEDQIDTTEIPLRVSPRWGTGRQKMTWSPWAQFIGSFFSDASEMVRISREIDGASLLPDIEHLAHVCQYANVMNLEVAEAGVLGVGALSDAQREALGNTGIDCSRDEAILFDYSNLSSPENDFLERHGIFFRPGQPLIYKERLTLRGELDKLSESGLPISEITPGFQVYQAIMDERNGQPALLIGSHMPGISEEYIASETVRDRLSREIRATHAVCYGFMQRNEIDSIEVESQMTDGEKIIYSGPEWIRQTGIAVHQLKDNLAAAERGEIDTNEGPYYL